MFYLTTHADLGLDTRFFPTAAERDQALRDWLRRELEEEGCDLDLEEIEALVRAALSPGEEFLDALRTRCLEEFTGSQGITWGEAPHAAEDVLRLFLAYHDNETPDSVTLESIVTAARAVT
jgi:hypothetical protein